jgi:hypothetical protein
VLVLSRSIGHDCRRHSLSALNLHRSLPEIADNMFAYRVSARLRSIEVCLPLLPDECSGHAQSLAAFCKHQRCLRPPGVGWIGCCCPGGSAWSPDKAASDAEEGEKKDGAGPSQGSAVLVLKCRLCRVHRRSGPYRMALSSLTSMQCSCAVCFLGIACTKDGEG